MEELKAARDLALTKLKDANRKMAEHVANKRGRMVDKHYEAVHTHYEKFEEKHIQYVLAAKLTMEDPAEQEKFFEATEVLDLAETTYSNYKDQLEVSAKHAAERRKEEVERERVLEEKRRLIMEFQLSGDVFDTCVQVHLDNVKNVEVEIDGQVLKEEISYLEQKFAELMGIYSELAAISTAEERVDLRGDRLDREGKFRKDLFTLKTYVSRQEKSERSSRVSSRLSSPDQRGSTAFKTKKLDYPTFDGEMRSYATFKRDFTEIVVNSKNYDTVHMSHILRNQCLSGEPKTLVHNVLDYEEIWKKLEDKYNDESEVIEQITKQITTLKNLEDGDYAGIIKLVDVVERANLDLRAAGNTTVLNNPMTVRLIMNRCPRTLREEITEELNGKQTSEEFDAMLAFLINKRKNAQRLARLAGDVKPKVIQPKQKGTSHATDGKRGDPGGGGGSRPWVCGTTGCTYKQKHFLSECRAFKKMSADDKGKVVLNRNLCVLCFGAHQVGVCPKKTAGWKPCDVGNCGKWHSRLLHGAATPGLVLITRQTNSTIRTGLEQIMLLVQYVPTARGMCATTFWDNGSTTSLVTFRFADSAGLQGVSCQFELTGVGEKTDCFKTKIYTIPLLTRFGETRSIQAFGIERITADLPAVSMAATAELLGVQEELIQRPAGQVDLLIGISEVDIYPIREKIVGKLALYNSQFGTGFLVGGQQGEVQGDAEIDKFAHHVSHTEARNIKPLDFFSAEGFGVDIPKRCRTCRGCKECGFKAGQLTWTEAMELAQIEKGLSLDTVGQVWTAEYPYKTDPCILKDNYSQAYACMASLERRLRRTQNLENFNQQFQDAVGRKVFEPVTKEEMQQYSGPINYITITEAFKDGEGTTTPLRLCMNSSMKYMGVSLNDLLMKGPSALNNIYSVLLNFRSYPHAFVKDLSKFYNSVLASERDQHLRRVLWRNGDSSVEPVVYKTSTVNFGDKPAGCVALTAVRETADLYKTIDEEAAEKLKNDNYVDDVASGAETRERAEEISKNMEVIVSKGGFKFKKTVMSGDKGEPMKVLGTGWDTERDTLFLEVKINVSNKTKGLRTEPDLDLSKVRDSFPTILTKRIIWRIVLGQFDLLGLASIFLIRLKLLMRDLSGEDGKKLGWDEPVEDDIRERFVNILDMLGEIRRLQFPRCFKPPDRDLTQQPDLLCFGDGSKQAFCTLAYIRYKLQDGSFKCSLLTGKTRVAPLRKISVPRIELLGAVASVRIAENIQSSLGIEFGRRFFFTDSSAVFGMIRGECGSFQEFVGTRTGEIKGKSSPEEEWFWLPTKENLADLGTRDDVTPELLGPDTVYLNGMKWMEEPEDKWPVNQTPGRVPEEELIPAARTVLATRTRVCLLDLEKYSSLIFVKRVLATVFYFLSKMKLLKRLVPDKNKVDHFISDAENYLLENAQTQVLIDYKDGKLVSLFPKTKAVQVLGRSTEVLVTSGRLGGAMAVGYDKDELPILPYNAHISRLYMYDGHAVDHSGTDRTLWRSRTQVWILRGRRLAEKVRNDCFKCRLRSRNLEKQIMAPLPESRIPPAPVFYNTAVDLFGPIEVRDTVKRRVKKKCWGVLFCCTVTSAIHLECSEDYSCDGFLLCLRRFFNIRGTPGRIQSDPGSQLMAAAVELGKWDFSKIQDWTSGQKTKWEFVPTNSQHFNGCAEALIKSTKKQLEESVKSTLFTKGELDTFLSDVMYIVNSRPLMKKAGQDPLDGGPITPLHLIGGRSTKDIPSISLDYNPSLTRRLKFIEDTTNEFWKKWFTQVFHNLVPCYKWRREYRDVQVGDVVLMRDSNVFKREYKLGRIKETFPGTDGHVRRVVIQYKNLAETGRDLGRAETDLRRARFMETERSIHNIAVIVPVDWTEQNIEAAVTQGLKYKCAF